MHSSTGGVRSPAGSPGDSMNESTAKAYKILGTADISVHENHHKREEKKRSRRPSFMRAPEIKSQKSGSFVPFPTAVQENTLPSHHLRVRASSPLLGHDYRPEDALEPPLPAPTKKVHQSGSASALFSYFTSRDSSANTNSGIGVATSDFGSTAENKPEPRQSAESGFSFRQPRGPMKESKRKMRPPRIDLSLLFPKPRATAEPLLSPQRMVESPSPVSIISEHPATKATNFESHAAGNRLTIMPPQPKDSARQSYIDQVHGAPASYETKNSNWLDPSLERTVRASEMDLALQKLQQDSQNHGKGRSSRSHSRSQGQEKRRTGDSHILDHPWKVSLNNSAGEWSKETHLSPEARLRQSSHRVSNSPDFRISNLHASAPLEKSSMPKKSSRTTLKTADLNSSSVLCLSSSEDEEDEEDEPTSDRPGRSRDTRDSVTTYGEFEPEICTAAAAQATKGTLRSIDPSISSRGSRPTQRHQSVRRDASQSSAGRSSYVTSSQSRRSSGIPTISEPEFFHGDLVFNQRRDQPRKSPSVSQKEVNRRSRVIAVTRQEENLLEAMRQRKGKITPSLFQESRFGNLEPDQGSMLSVPSRDSFYGSDMSFLRLSPALPPKSVQVSATRSDREGSVCQSTFSDEEQKTINSFPSPRTSLAFSEGLSSPSTSAASPLTPTLPIHRFSPIPSQKPPPRRPIPAVPQDKRRHSRRRTDSSEAIVLEESDETKQNDELPMWTLRWNNDNGTMTAVH